VKVNVFVDSSVFVEFFKDKKEAIEIVEFIANNIEKIRVNINAIVWSEVVYQLVIKRKFPKEDVFEFLNSFKKLEINSEVIEIAQNFVGDLYTNDALNFASAYYFGINYFITLDSDFKSSEDIFVIQNVESLKEIIK